MDKAEAKARLRWIEREGAQELSQQSEPADDGGAVVRDLKVAVLKQRVAEARRRPDTGGRMNHNGDGPRTDYLSDHPVPRADQQAQHRNNS